MRKRNHLHRLKTTPEFFSLNNVVSKMHISPQTLTLNPSQDLTSLLPDKLLIRILSDLPFSNLATTSLVSKRWRNLTDQLRHSLTLLNWSFLSNPSIRLTNRFQNLTKIDLFPAAFETPSFSSSPITLTRGLYSLRMQPFSASLPFIDSEEINIGLEILARGCPQLQKLCAVAPLESELGLAAVALECPTLQELELHRCSDTALRPISAFQNLQILRLVASMKGLYDGPGVSDVGLTILAHGCKRLVKLELGGCEASFDGISAIGRCCMMLEELAVFDDWRMERGWLAAVPCCGNLKTLRLQSCRNIVGWGEDMERVGCCPTIERLVVQRCQLRDKRGLKALFLVCEYVKEIGFQSCWGLDNDMFRVASICRRVKLLSLEGCSKITTEGLESVLLSWHDLQSLTVVSCNGIKDDNVSPALSGLFSVLKEFKWRPDSRSVLSMSLQGTGMGKKGGKFFRRLRG